jgi:hypothetical protein
MADLILPCGSGGHDNDKRTSAIDLSFMLSLAVIAGNEQKAKLFLPAAQTQ